MIRVLLADDQELVRSGFSLILSVEEDIEVVGEAHDGQQAVQLAEQLKPDVVLMDVQMPQLDGIAATAAITEVIPQVSVLILTTFDREDYLFAALAAGASGFLLKSAGADELVAAVRKVAGGLALLSPEMTLPLIQRFAAQARTGKGGSQKRQDGVAQSTGVEQLAAADVLAMNSLTPRELEILGLLAQGLTNAEIAQQLFVGAETIKTHVSNILAKTASRDRVGAVIFAHRVGVAGS